MGKLVVGTFVSVDGVMQAPGGPDEDRSGGFQLGGWTFPLWDDEMGRVIDEWTGQAGALLLGRKTYEIFAAHWPRVDDGDPMAAMLNRVPKYVASTTLKRVDWRNSQLLKGDVPDAIAKLRKESGGDVQVMGSGNLIQTLLKHDLVDEYRLWIFPVLLGGGKRLFDDGTVPSGLKLTRSMTFGTGVVVQCYERAGEVKTGSFAIE